MSSTSGSKAINGILGGVAAVVLVVLAFLGYSKNCDQLESSQQVGSAFMATVWELNVILPLIVAIALVCGALRVLGRSGAADTSQDG